jgi:TetR/AcrR family transcriptional regulator, transcriptional repressor of bet genes
VNSRARRRLRRRPTKLEMMVIGDRRKQLLSATMQTIQLYGLEKLTLAKVTDVASVTPAVVGFHFSGKQGLLAETLRELVGAFDGQLRSTTAAIEDPRERLRCAVRIMLDEEIASERHVAVWYAFMGERGWREVYNEVTDKHDRRFQEFVAQCFKERAQQLGCSPVAQLIEAAARGFIGMLDGFWQEILFDNSRFDRSAAARVTGTYLEFMDCVFRHAEKGKGSP